MKTEIDFFVGGKMVDVENLNELENGFLGVKELCFVGCHEQHNYVAWIQG